MCRIRAGGGYMRVGELSEIPENEVKQKTGEGKQGF